MDENVQISQLECMLRSVMGEFEARVNQRMDEGMTDVKTVLTYLQDKWVEHDKEIWHLKRKA